MKAQNKQNAWFEWCSVFSRYMKVKSRKSFSSLRSFPYESWGNIFIFISWLELLESSQVHELRAKIKITWINIKITLQPFWPFNFHFSWDFNHETILMEILIRPPGKKMTPFEYWDTITVSIMAIIWNSKFLRRNTVYNFSLKCNYPQVFHHLKQ